MITDCTHDSGTIESIYMSQGEILGYKGIVLRDRVSATCFSFTHFDCQNTCYENTSLGGEHRVIGCDLRNERLERPSFPGFTMFLNADGCNVQGCAIRGYQAELGCVNAGGTPEHINVSNNIMAGSARPGQLAIRVDPGAEDVVFGGNTRYHSLKVLLPGMTTQNCLFMVNEVSDD